MEIRPYVEVVKTHEPRVPHDIIQHSIISLLKNN